MKAKLLLPILSGLLCWFAWPPIPYTSPLLLVALVPMLFYADAALGARRPGRFLFWGTALGFAVWNTLSLSWIYYIATSVGVLSGISGVLVPIFFGTALMTLPFFLYHKIRKYYGQTLGYTSLIAFWIGAEYLHHTWDFAFPWLTLGNGFADFPQLVQWYEYTGVFGGSVWVILNNILVYSLIKTFREKRKLAFRIKLKRTVILVAWTGIPVAFSVQRFYTYQETPRPVGVVVVQPNVDPYNEKFASGTEQEQLGRLLHLSDSLGEPNTELFVWPESALGAVYPVDEAALPDHKVINTVQYFLKRYTNAQVLSGASSIRFYDSKKTLTARKCPDRDSCYYDFFNTAFQIENGEEVQVYHKNKLVAGVEQLPYQRYLGFLGNLMMDLGGASGTLGHDGTQPVFYTYSGLGIAPLICYESVFGAYAAKFVRQGAQLICVITNDGWWSNTAGYKQHAAYARLRAIETRRSIARSANTGISMLINQRGEVLQKTGWWRGAAIRGELNLNDIRTFYVKHGDYLAKIGVFLSALSFLGLLFASFTRRRKKAGVPS